MALSENASRTRTYKPFFSKALRYGQCVTMRSHSFTCHPHRKIGQENRQFSFRCRELGEMPGHTSEEKKYKVKRKRYAEKTEYVKMRVYPVADKVRLADRSPVEACLTPQRHREAPRM